MPPLFAAVFPAVTNLSTIVAACINLRTGAERFLYASVDRGSSALIAYDHQGQSPRLTPGFGLILESPRPPAYLSLSGQTDALGPFRFPVGHSSSSCHDCHQLDSPLIRYRPFNQQWGGRMLLRGSEAGSPRIIRRASLPSLIAHATADCLRALEPVVLASLEMGLLIRWCALFVAVWLRHGLNYIGKPTFSQHYFLLVDICYRNSDNCVMTPNDLKKHFGTKAKIARATGASWASVQDWFNNGEVPEGRQYQIELATKGQLRASRPANRSEDA